MRKCQSPYQVSGSVPQTYVWNMLALCIIFPFWHSLYQLREQTEIKMLLFIGKLLCHCYLLVNFLQGFFN